MGSALVVTTCHLQPPGCSGAQAGLHPPACPRDVRAQPELGDIRDPPGPMNGEMWHFSVTARVSYGVVTTISFPSPEVSRLGIPLAPSQDVLKASFWVSHPSGKMVLWSQTPEQAPGCVCPPSMLFPSLPQFSQHHTRKQTAKTTPSRWKGNNTQSRQSS